MSLEVKWTRREPPLAPAAVTARGAVARVLAARLARLDDERLARLFGVAAEDLLVIAGEDLPWVDGVSYVGVDADAPRLMMPTTRAPNMHAALVEAALVARAGVAPPLVVLEDFTIVSFADARAVQRARLERWIGGAS
jgi:hypothetical protein